MPEEPRPEGVGTAAEGNISFTSPESLPVTPSPEGAVEHAPEAAEERAGEKFSEILAKVPTAPAAAAQPADTAVVVDDAKSIAAEMDEETRVTKLVSLAQVKGVAHAVKVAEHLNDYYVLDRMHDELADKFYDALKAKGMIDA